ncbi:MAG: hypothetical protein RL637_1198 [Pseudomonadota bacterium]
MNLSEVNWDFNTAGNWPLQVKILVISVICCVLFSAGVYQFTLPQLDELKKLETTETELFTSLENKQKKAANLIDYKNQLDQIEKLLKGMLEQMPDKAEVPDLLLEISNIAKESGLETKLFEPQPEVAQDFYIELPYKIEMAGKYEELGLFISGLATLSRIVTIHEVAITRATDADERLTMAAVIKTYNDSSGRNQNPPADAAAPANNSAAATPPANGAK